RRVFAESSPENRVAHFPAIARHKLTHPSPPLAFGRIFLEGPALQFRLPNFLFRGFFKFFWPRSVKHVGSQLNFHLFFWPTRFSAKARHSSVLCAMPNDWEHHLF